MMSGQAYSILWLEQSFIFTYQWLINNFQVFDKLVIGITLSTLTINMIPWYTCKECKYLKNAADKYMIQWQGNCSQYYTQMVLVKITF